MAPPAPLDGFMQVSYRQPPRKAQQQTGRGDPNAIDSAPTYDAKGNLTTGFDGSIYVYDAQNRLISATVNGVTETFKYDGLNRQVSRTLSGATTYSVYDGWSLLGEYSSGSNVATRAWAYGATGMIKELVSGNYYYQDGLGSTSHLANSTGNLLEWYRYDLQGTPVFYDASNNPITASAYGITHLYTGQRWSSDLGLYDLRNRYYSPDIGRFLQPDPIGFSGDPSNMYRYCGNNPVNWSDPSGLGWFKNLLRSISGFFSGSSSNPSPSNSNGPSNPTNSGGPDEGERIIVTGQDIQDPNNRSGLTSLGGNGWVNGNSPQGLLGLLHLPFSGGGGGGFGIGTGVSNMPLLRAPMLVPERHSVTVAFYNAAGPFGHVGAGVDTSYTDGFYPVESSINVVLGQDVPGVFHSDTQDIRATLTFAITGEQASAMGAFQGSMLMNPGTYNLYNCSCVNAVMNTLNAGGIVVPYSMYPAQFYDNVVYQQAGH